MLKLLALVKDTCLLKVLRLLQEVALQIHNMRKAQMLLCLIKQA